MIGKRVKNIFKLGVLIGIRQMWGLGRNLYLLTYQPYLTLKDIREKRDKSQLVLVSIFVILPAVGYILLRIIWDRWKYGLVLPSVGSVFVGVAVIEILMLAYVGYWTWRVIKE